MASQPVRGTTAFFNPSVCPDCGAWLGVTRADLRCDRCGLVLSGPTAERLGSTLLEADRLLAELRQQSVAGAPSPQAQAMTPPQYAGAQYPGAQYPGAHYPGGFTPRPRRPLNVAAILLSLGALCLVVAAVVFVSINWGTMSLGMKVVVLTLLTASLAGVAGVVSHRGLRASAEALWTITFIDVFIDFVAAKHAGLWSIENFTWPAWMCATTTVLAIAAVGVSLLTARTKVGVPLVSTQLIAGLAAPAAVEFALTSNHFADWSYETVVSVFALAATYGAWRIRLRIAMIPIALDGASTWLALSGTGVYRIFDADYASKLVHGQEPHLIAAVLLTLGAAAAFDRVYRRVVPVVSGLGYGLLAALGYGVMRDVLPAEVAFAPVLLVTTAAVFVPRNRWTEGARWVFAGALGIGALVVIDEAMSSLNVLQQQASFWNGSARDHLFISSLYTRDTFASFVMLGALTLAAGAGTRLIRFELTRFLFCAGGIAAPLAAAISLQTEPMQWVGCTAFLVAAVVSAALSWAGREKVLWLAVVPAVTLAYFVALPSAVLTLATAVVATAVVAAASLAFADPPEARTALELVALVNLFGIGASLTHVVQPDFTRPDVVGLLTVAAFTGVVCVLSASRHWWRWISASTALLASWIVASQFEHQIVEWYSLPLGTVALLFGISAVRHSKTRFDSWLFYGPGLLVLTVPSLVLALQHPTTVRAALVGAWLVGLIAVGVVANLRAPLLIGAVAGAMLAFAELWPYAVAAPRWVTLGLVGVALLAVGVTWEDRRADWTHAQRTLHSMH